MIEAKWALGSDLPKEAVELRKKVFIEEMHLDDSTVSDMWDKMAQHVLIYDGPALLATGRILYDGRTATLSRLAVLPNRRGAGVGEMLARILIFRGFDAGAKSVQVDTPESAVGFFKLFGFRAVSPSRMLEGTMQIRMEATEPPIPKCQRKK